MKNMSFMGGHYVSPETKEITVVPEQVFATSLEATHEGFSYAYDYDDEE